MVFTKLFLENTLAVRLYITAGIEALSLVLKKDMGLLMLSE